MTKRSAVAILLSVMLGAGAMVAWPAPASASRDGASPLRHQLHALRKATAKFHNIKATLRSGRVDLHLCVDQMGQHFADPTTFSDGVLDPVDPEAMVYEDRGNGHLRLVAVEWVSTTPGDMLGMPLHFNPDVGLWVMHAWIWKSNPDGMFADMNPRVGDCP